MPESTHKVAVYVPAYNVEDYLDDCLESLKRQTYPLDSLVVVDDGSTDRSGDIARKHGVQILDHEENKGLSTARNNAFELVDARYIGSLDADCVAEPTWLEILMKEIASTGIAGVSGRLIEKNRTSLPDKWRHVHMKQHWGDSRMVAPLHLFGNNTVFRRDAVLDAGNYPCDPQYRTNNEDYYISRRLIERGYQLVYQPAARVHHLRTDTVFSLFQTYWRWFFLHRHQPNSPRTLFRKTADNVVIAVSLLVEDLRARDIRMMFMDLLFLFYQSYFDVKYFRAKNNLP